MKNPIPGVLLSAVLLCMADAHSADRGGTASGPKQERSESGSPIYRHQARETKRTTPEREAKNLEEIEAHIEKYIGKIETVFHETVSDLIHLDVLFVPATADRPYHVLVTSGVSDLPMTVPDGLEEFRHAEILIALPAQWPLNEEAFQDEANYWPIGWLKLIGRLPHEYKTWIGWGHTIPNGDPPEPIANTDFIGAMLMQPYHLPPEFFQLQSRSGETISFYLMMPLYQEEMDLKLKAGAEEIEERLGRRNIGFALDTKRANVAKTRR